MFLFGHMFEANVRQDREDLLERSLLEQITSLV